MHEQLTAAVYALQDDIIHTLSQWIQIPTEKEAPAPDAPFGLPLQQMLHKALSDAAALGFATRNIDGYAGDITLNAGDETLGILAHLDVVPKGEGWTHAPYGGTFVDGRVWGRGASDNKGPAVAALYAMKAVKESGIPLTRSVRLILGCDEESGMDDMKYYAKKVKMPDFGFSPDAAFPLINTEKGICQIELTASFAPKDCTRRVLSVTAGERPNVIPGKAYAEIPCRDIDGLRAALAGLGYKVTAEPMPNGHVQLISEGIAGHAAMPDHSLNAAGQLLLALKGLSVDSANAVFMDALADTVGIGWDGQGLGINGWDAISGALTLNLGILNITETDAVATLDIRYPVLMSGQRIGEIMQKRLAKYGITVNVKLDKAPLHIPEESFIVEKLLAVYRDATGDMTPPIAIGGGTYSRTMPNCVAFGASFPGDHGGAHQPDEFIVIDQLMKAAAIMAEAIVALCA